MEKKKYYIDSFCDLYDYEIRSPAGIIELTEEEYQCYKEAMERFEYWYERLYKARK